MLAPKLLNLFMADFRWGAGMLDIFFNQKFTRNEAVFVYSTDMIHPCLVDLTKI